MTLKGVYAKSLFSAFLFHEDKFEKGKIRQERSNNLFKVHISCFRMNQKYGKTCFNITLWIAILRC